MLSNILNKNLDYSSTIYRFELNSQKLEKRKQNENFSSRQSTWLL